MLGELPLYMAVDINPYVAFDYDAEMSSNRRIFDPEPFVFDAVAVKLHWLPRLQQLRIE